MNTIYRLSSIGASSALFICLVVLAIDILLFIWKKKIAEDILFEKGYEKGTKKVGALMFFLPVVCWIYVVALPKKAHTEE